MIALDARSTAPDQHATLDRLTTGDVALDRILGGGIPTRSVTVIAGEPGSGKTVLALQMLFHLARQGRKTLYLTTLSEPALKLIRYMQLFPFFDQALLDDGRVVFADLGSTLREDGGERALEEVAERVEREQPDLVVIDSFKAIHDLIGEPSRSRTFVFDLAVTTAGWGATTLLVGEYTVEDVSLRPEFAIADGILRLSTERRELTAVRELEVRKLRGAAYIGGRHFFEIGPGGAAFYPRVQAPESDAPPPAGAGEPVPTGVAGLDDLLRGGLPRASATLVEGPTGTGKTLLGLQFLLDGARRGEPGILFTLEETPAQLRRLAATLNWDLAALEARGQLALHHTSPVELSPDRFLDRLRQQVEAAGARRVVLDGLTALALGVPSERRFKELVYALTKHFLLAGVTLVATVEAPALLGVTHLAASGVSAIADNVLVLRYVEHGQRLARAVSVLKARGVAHETEVRRLSIGPGGVQVGKAFGNLRGVLTGGSSALPAEPARLPSGEGTR